MSKGLTAVRAGGEGSQPVTAACALSGTVALEDCLQTAA